MWLTVEKCGFVFFFFLKGLQCFEQNKERGRETIGVWASQCPAAPESKVCCQQDHSDCKAFSVNINNKISILIIKLI